MKTTLASHRFLEGLSPEQLKRLSGIATKAQFGIGETIIRQNDFADRFYLIEKGLVGLDYRLPRQRKVRIQTIGPGEVLGWSWLFEPFKWQFTATALERTTVDVFRASELRKLFAADPKLAAALMERIAKALTERLQATRHKLLVYVERANNDESGQQVC